MVLMIGVHVHIGHRCEDEVDCNHDGAHWQIELKVIVPIDVLEGEGPSVGKEHEKA
jgi:hypothetical protein